MDLDTLAESLYIQAEATKDVITHVGWAVFLSVTASAFGVCSALSLFGVIK